MAIDSALIILYLYVAKVTYMYIIIYSSNDISTCKYTVITIGKILHTTCTYSMLYTLLCSTHALQL